MAAYPQSQTYTRTFYAYSSTDHVSAATGVTITMELSKAGGAFSAAGGTITEVANGLYKIALTTTDTNTLGDLSFYGTGTGMDPVKFTDQVIDAVRGLGSPTALPNANAGASGGLPLSVDTSGRVDVLKINGTSQTARDIGANIDVATSTRLASADYTAPDNTDIAAIKAKTDNLPSDPADESLVIAATDAIMSRLGDPAGASTAADIAAVKTDTAAIKTQTDKMNFNSSWILADIKGLNGTTLNGDGSATPWGP